MEVCCALADAIVETDLGHWLVEHRSELEQAEALWLERLAEFDLSAEWALDGHTHCATWLSWRLKMARSTAFEKLQVAHQLRRRPIIAEAFRQGRLSYSAMRTICRVNDPDPDVDTALVMLAEAGTVKDVERAVRFYQLHADQERPPADLAVRQSVRCKPNGDGTSTVAITVPDVEAQELIAILQAYIDRQDPRTAALYNGSPVDESARADSDEAVPANPVDESARADNDETALADPVDESARAYCRLDPNDQPPFGSRMAQAFMDMARVALAHIDGPPAAGADRYMLHLIIQDGHTESLDGTPVSDSVASRIACDASTVTHLLGAGGEPLALGRKTREWSTPQRRAIMVRDGGLCRFPGCPCSRFVDIHHHHWWSKGGPTDVDNGFLQCSHHHDLIHKGGYIVEGDPNGTLTFYRPDRTFIGSTRPCDFGKYQFEGELAIRPSQRSLQQ
jgi:hypothetical protein